MARRIVIDGTRRVNRQRRHHNTGFSLLELVIVVVILGAIAAIAIPRLGRASSGAASSALKQDLAVMRKALDMFVAEHHGLAPTLANIEKQLTEYTDIHGDPLPTKDSTHIYGPYLKKIPPQPVGKYVGCTAFCALPGTADCGWLYLQTIPEIRANTTIEKDDANVFYNHY